MAEEDGAATTSYCVHVGMAAASYFFPEIAYKCCTVQRTVQPTSVYYWWNLC